MASPSLELVSFDLCPFVQRAVILLLKKQAAYRVTYIDLAEPPAWFEEISPLGQVPLLKVDEKTVLFESQVIAEYLDETVGQPLHSRDPLQKALERAWIEYGSQLLGLSYRVLAAADADDLKDLVDELFTDLARLEPMIQGAYFRGAEFGLVDATYAPLFMRMDALTHLKQDPRWAEMPKVRAWADRLTADAEVKKSVPGDFQELYLEYCEDEMQGYIIALQ